MTSNLTIGGLLDTGIRRLMGSSEAPHLDAELLLAHALGVSRAWIKSHAEEERKPAEGDQYLRLIDRRAAGEPIAYIVGYKDFWTLRLLVNPAVLVPRPETELLVERALALCDKAFARVADLGTGSGAIALAIATERPQWHVVATDASPEALAVARANAEALGLLPAERTSGRSIAPHKPPMTGPSTRSARFELLQGAWFEPLRGRRFDLVVSNPPYVAADDPAMSQPALRYEPRAALTPGADAMSSLRTIIREAPDYLEPEGWLLLEHGATQAAEVAHELVARGFTHVRSHRDLAGHERMTEAQWR